MGLPVHTLEKLERHLSSSDPLQINILIGDNPYRLPVIFIGKMYHRILLFPHQITAELLEQLIQKTISDSNRKATIDLLRYAAYNEITFWERYKDTNLGVQVMATVLGHD